MFYKHLLLFFGFFGLVAVASDVQPLQVDLFFTRYLGMHDKEVSDNVQ